VKPYFEDNGVTIYHGDAREFITEAHSVIGAGFDLILTDPPYNEVNRHSNGITRLDRGDADALEVDIPWFAEQFAYLATGSIYVWCGMRQLSKWLDEFVAHDLSVRGGMWHKTNAMPLNAENIWVSALEAVAFARKPLAYFDHDIAPLYFHGRSTPMADVHPTAKPLWLFQEIVEASCPPGGTVLDPFMGSGTTLEACIKTGRQGVGIDINEEYCDLAARRLSQGALF
jgi:site-specific DNA-methyltransferase (adenine-specific)